MADESETAGKPPAPPLPQLMEGNGNGHEHCSDCENEEDSSYNRGGLSPANDTGAKKKKRKQKKKKEKGNELDSALDQPVKEKQEHRKAHCSTACKTTTKQAHCPPVGADSVGVEGGRTPFCGCCFVAPRAAEAVTAAVPPKCLLSVQLKELYTLLNENYVEDDDNMFRFDYSPEFLLWALRPPGWLPQWHCGVRVVSSRKLVGFISAIPANIHIYDTEKKMVEINFLCVHKKLRSKRVAPVLIREITRRVHLEGIFQAVYTAGVVLPKPVGTCRYWHRSLNPRKLIEVKFSHLSRNMTMQRTMKLYRLPEVPKTAGLRAMGKKDVPAVHRLLTRYLEQFHLTPVMSQEEVEHWFSPQENIIDTFVVENANGEVTDFLSFYTLPSTIMNHPTHKSLKAAYSFYNVHTQTPLLDLMSDALVLAKMKGFDVFNALDLMENKAFLEKLKFGIGDGNLQYYLYNWKCPSMGAEKVGLVLQ
ncbi:glycylpeptide N-tetradecanoyltransferase 1 [Echinops telfairi]|uniref:Glycylpeptide N-tetradecanoyltransferase 1 n=1 Tax=Echinops telfairi TaxID=9371 RepID=A0AC55DUI6_ECHTE|nr:glycylpeptide N-tetradecanoyltransferase 1 [Echinops telfairi]